MQTYSRKLMSIYCPAEIYISSERARRPLSLEKRKRWKANEWKMFVLSTSLVVMHGWVAEDVLSG